jgi:hypothetical protein
MKLKRPTGWFPAGTEAQKAFIVLSDGAFRLYFLICMKALHSTGIYTCSYEQLASEIGRSKRSVCTYAAELRQKGVCDIRAGVNQHENSDIEICDEFWPYEKSAKPNRLGSPDFMQALRKLLNERACVNSAFGILEQEYARALRDNGVSLVHIQRAVHLGCLRKYVSLLNHEDGQQISSLLYFRDVIDEVNRTDVSENYWEYVFTKLTCLERDWITLVSKNNTEK